MLKNLIAATGASLTPPQHSPNGAESNLNSSAFSAVYQQLKQPDTATKATPDAPSVTTSHSTTPISALEEFLAYMALSPAEKIRARLLKEMNLTEEELRELPPEEKQKIEAIIAQRIRDETEAHMRTDANKKYK